MLQQLHSIASGAYVPGHGARLMTQVYARPQRLSLSSQFTGRSTCYMTRVIVCMWQNHSQEYYHRGHYFQNL
jgi:hypothetical protein